MAQRRVSVVWGESGLGACRAHEVCVIVDVLSFSTAVVAACEAGARVYPYRWKDGTAREFARSVAAELASTRPIRTDSEGLDSGEQNRYDSNSAATASLSPLSLTALARGSALVLPFP